jgi:A/G-specific adenine glycosylase
VLSLAFDARQPILEANTARLFARLLAYRGDPRAKDGQRVLWGAAESILPARGSGEVNQALMELGSQVCTPRAPRCDSCPLSICCETNAQNLHERIPRRIAKPRVERVREAAVVVHRGEKVFLVQRPAHGRWAGLWEFPRFAVAARSRNAIQQALVIALRDWCGLHIETGSVFMTLRHSVTRFRITLDCYKARLIVARNELGRRRLTGGGKSPGTSPAASDEKPYAAKRWLRLNELADYPLNRAARRISTSLLASQR